MKSTLFLACFLLISCSFIPTEVQSTAILAPVDVSVGVDGLVSLCVSVSLPVNVLGCMQSQGLNVNVGVALNVLGGNLADINVSVNLFSNGWGKFLYCCNQNGVLNADVNLNVGQLLFLRAMVGLPLNLGIGK